MRSMAPVGYTTVLSNARRPLNSVSVLSAPMPRRLNCTLLVLAEPLK